MSILDRITMFFDNYKSYIYAAALAILLIGMSYAAFGQEPAPGLNEPNDAQHDHKVYGRILSDNAVVLIQKGSFDCKVTQHRAFYVDIKSSVFVGCAEFNDAGDIHIVFENGQIIDLKKNASTNPSRPDKLGNDT